MELKLLSLRNLSGLCDFMMVFIWCKTEGVNWSASEAKSKNACCPPRSQKPRFLLSTLASFELFDVLPCSCSPDNGVSLGSISVFLHISDNILAVRSRKSLCRMYINLPFLRLILCRISNLLPQDDKMLVDSWFSNHIGVLLNPRIAALMCVCVFAYFHSV